MYLPAMLPYSLAQRGVSKPNRNLCFKGVRRWLSTQVISGRPRSTSTILLMNTTRSFSSHLFRQAVIRRRRRDFVPAPLGYNSTIVSEESESASMNADICTAEYVICFHKPFGP